MRCSSSETVLVADADCRSRGRLAHDLTAAGFSVLEAETGEQALELARSRTPSLILLEVPLGEISGYEVCRLVHEDLDGEVPVIFVSGARTESYDRVAGLLVGADDYVVKPYAVDELLARVRRLIERCATTPAPLAQLTPREREILGLLAEGLSAKEIAGTLVISSKTVGTHIEHILTKLNARSRVQAVTIAYREGLVPAGVAG